ncbi:MAG: hypothetical protein ACFFER_16010 [Candidatus Thorarchaeota archaeon]
MSVELTVTKKTGRKRQLKCSLDSYNRMEIYTKDHTEKFVDIDLTPLSEMDNLESLMLHDNGLRRIDLSPLSSCANLKDLRVTDNHKNLETINLSPLASCSKLQRLDLSRNHLQNIDLSPLSSCSSFKDIILDENQLQHVDLSPLSKCVTFMRLGLLGNPLQSVDLSPLSQCVNLRLVNLAGTKLQNVSLSPLASCQCSHIYLQANEIESVDITSVLLNPALEMIDHDYQFVSWVADPYEKRKLKGHHWSIELKYSVDPPAPEESWSFLHKLANIPQGLSIPVQSYILKSLGFEHFGLIDADISKFLCSIPPETSIDEAPNIVRPFLIETVCEQIDRGGTTILLDINSLMGIGEIARRLDSILELRDTEMMQVKVNRWLHMVWQYQIQPLVLTAYGFSILMQIRGFSDPEFQVIENEFKPILKLFRETGYEISIVTEDEYDHELFVPKHMSRQMKNYVLNLASRMDLDDSLYAMRIGEVLRKTFRAHQLRDLLQKHKLSTKGTKRELVLRIIEAKGTDFVRRILEEHQN